MIDKLRQAFSIPFLCSVFRVSKSGYYKWRSRGVPERVRKDEQLKLHVVSFNKRTHNVYGVDRLRVEMSKNGVQISKWKLMKLRRELGIYCKQRKKYRATTNSNHSYPVSENILNRNFVVESPNKVWLSDITYIPTEEGFLYLSSHKDLFNNEIVGYSFGERMTKELVMNSFLMAVKRRKPSYGLIHHSDRGSQYCSYAYRDLLKSHNVIQSMSGKGDCYDNAPMESFWGILKTELTNGKKYKTRAEAISDIVRYIEIFYNRERIQSKLGYLSPIKYLKKYYEGMKVA